MRKYSTLPTKITRSCKFHGTKFIICTCSRLTPTLLASVYLFECSDVLMCLWMNLTSPCDLNNRNCNYFRVYLSFSLFVCQVKSETSARGKRKNKRKEGKGEEKKTFLLEWVIHVQRNHAKSHRKKSTGKKEKNTFDSYNCTRSTSNIFHLLQ